jgi:MFS family permease
VPQSPLERRNLALLAVAQALVQTTAVLMVTITGLVGLVLASDKALATLPVALTMIAGAAMMIPASLLMQRHGRRAGFLIGVTFGVLGGVAATTAVLIGSFALFCVATMLIGIYQAFAQYYRFAAAEAVSEGYRSRAISWVIGAGVVAAIAGPNLARLTQGVGPRPYAASFAVVAVLGLAALALIARLRLPPAPSAAIAGAGRPLAQIAAQPVFLTAVACSTVGYAVMVLVMTATPIAMYACGFGLGASATVIQWHVLGMFAPAFFTGSLVDRFGPMPMICVGIGLLATEVAVAVSGIRFVHFIASLVLLGVGWNFLFIGGTTLLTRSYRPEERAKAQATHDFITFGAASLASLLAGSVHEAWGWRTVNLAAVPLLFIALLAITGFALARHWRASPPPETARIP